MTNRRRQGKEETEVDVGTDELVDAAPVVESPCHCEQLATVSRGLLRYASGREDSPRDATATVAAAAIVGVADPRPEGVRSVPPSSASGILRARTDQAVPLLLLPVCRRDLENDCMCDDLNPRFNSIFLIDFFNSNMSQKIVRTSRRS